MKLSRLLKKKIRESPLPLPTLAHKTGVDQATLSRFKRDQSNITLRTAEKLIKYFKIEFTLKA